MLCLPFISNIGGIGSIEGTHDTTHEKGGGLVANLDSPRQWGKGGQPKLHERVGEEGQRQGGGGHSVVGRPRCEYILF
jgi:hypothetical protein